MFSGGIEKQHWAVMGEGKILTVPPSYFTSCPCTYFSRDIKYMARTSEILLFIENREYGY